MLTWAPYTSDRRKGALLDISNLYPTEYGSYRAAPVFTASGTAAAGPATPGTTLNAWCAMLPAGTAVGYVGTTTKLYQIDTTTGLSAGSFTDRSIAGGYSIGVGGWHFTQYGNITIACNIEENTQYRDSSGSSAFANLTNAPKAKIAVTQSNCVLLFNVNDGASKPSGYYITDVGDYTNWTTGEAVNGEINSRPGPITQAVALRDEVIVFKSSSIFRGHYVGAPQYWLFDLIADGVGVDTRGAVAVCGDFLVFVGRQGNYIYDGARLQRIGEGFDNGGYNYLWESASSTGGASLGDSSQQAWYFPASNHVVFPHSTDTGFENPANIVYNVTSNKFGKFLLTVTGETDVYKYAPMVGDVAAIEGMSSTVSAKFGTHSTAANALYYIRLDNDPCVIVDDGGNASTWYFITWKEGNEHQITHWNEAQLVCCDSSNHNWTMPAAGSYTATVYSYTGAADAGQATVVTAQVSSSAQNTFNFQTAARFMNALIAGTSVDVEFEDIIFSTNKQAPRHAGRD